MFAEFLWGFGMIAFEIFFPPRLVEVSSSRADVTAPDRLLDHRGLGAVGGRRRLRALAGRGGSARRSRAAPCESLHGLTVLGMALAVGPAGLIVAYLATYFAHGATAPVHYGMVHRAVESSHRATVVSANSLTSQLGGALSGIALGALADATSLSTAMAVAAVVLASAGPLYLARPSGRPGRGHAGAQRRRPLSRRRTLNPWRSARSGRSPRFQPHAEPVGEVRRTWHVSPTGSRRWERVGGADAEGSYA